MLQYTVCPVDLIYRLNRHIFRVFVYRVASRSYIFVNILLHIWGFSMTIWSGILWQVQMILNCFESRNCIIHLFIDWLKCNLLLWPNYAKKSPNEHNFFANTYRTFTPFHLSGRSWNCNHLANSKRNTLYINTFFHPSKNLTYFLYDIPSLHL